MRLSLMRGGVPEAVVIEAQPAAAAGPASLSVRLLRDRGSVIEAVERGLAERSGLRVGDVIVQAGEVMAPSPDEIAAMREKAAPGSVLVLTVERAGRRHLVALTAPPPSNAAAAKTGGTGAQIGAAPPKPK
jgi:S1-C subfamily serine protease